MQQPPDLDRLKERYRFDDWKEPQGASAGRAPPLTFTGDEFPAWRLVRQTRREPPGHPPFVRSMWQGESAQVLMGVDVHECASPLEAREYLLRRLGEMQGPVLARADAPDLGEVAFVTPGETMIVFARGSIVAVLHTAGRRVIPLSDASRTLDRLLRERAGGESR
jgi:hypothetical protein